MSNTPGTAGAQEEALESSRIGNSPDEAQEEREKKAAAEEERGNEDEEEEFFFDEPDNSLELHVTAELKQDLEAGREVNATRVVHAAEAAVEDIVQTAKAAAEQALGKAKKVDVAVRAIEIASELTEAITKGKQQGGNSGKVANSELVKSGEQVVSSEKGSTAAVKSVEKGPPLLGNLTAVAEAVVANKAAEKLEEEFVGKSSVVKESRESGEARNATAGTAGGTPGRKSSRKIDPAGD